MENLYADIAARTGGNIYIGVVGPVRTGKSTLVKRIMESMVIPGISDPYRAERAKDELPQSGSGKTIMTTEPKFVPEAAVEICPDGGARLRVRLIDSVGYMVDGAVGAEEDDTIDYGGGHRLPLWRRHQAAGACGLQRRDHHGLFHPRCHCRRLQ